MFFSVSEYRQEFPARCLRRQNGFLVHRSKAGSGLHQMREPVGFSEAATCIRGERCSSNAVLPGRMEPKNRCGSPWRFVVSRAWPGVHSIIQPADRAGRQPRAVPAQQRRQDILEITGGNSFQVQRGKSYSRLLVRQRQGGRIAGVRRILPSRSRSRGIRPFLSRL
jgi:hypothetical protein